MSATDVWDVYNILLKRDRWSLSDAQRGLVAVCDLRQEVNSGGFDSYFRYWGGNSAPEALAALPGLLSHEWADLLSEAMALLGPNYPTTQDVREELLDNQDLDEQLEALDDRYYALEGAMDADGRLNEYLARTPEAGA